MEPLTLHIDTTLPGADLSYQISGNNTEIDWGDGSPVTGPGTHTYDEHGQYTIRVYGGVGQGITCGNRALRTVETFGDYGASRYVFGSATTYRQSRNLISLPDVLPSSVTSMINMFRGCSSLTDISALSGWDTSSVTSMINMFYGCSSLTDISALSGWDTSSVRDMANMFANCTSLTDISALSGWDTSNVTDMSYMFSGCIALTLTPGDLAGWDTGNVTDMRNMFAYCSALTDISALSGWDTSSVRDMSGMFYVCTALATGDLSGWCVSNIPAEPSNFRTAADNWNGPFPVWGTCPPPKPSYYGPNMLEADTPNWVCGKAPNALEAGEPNALEAGTPNLLVSQGQNLLVASHPNTLLAYAPNALKAPEPNILEATEPNLVVPQGFAVLRD